MKQHPLFLDIQGSILSQHGHVLQLFVIQHKTRCEQSKVISKRHATAERKSLSTAERVQHLVGLNIYIRGQVVEMEDLHEMRLQQLRMEPSIVRFRMI